MKKKKSAKKIILFSVVGVLSAALVLKLAFSGGGGVSVPVQVQALEKTVLRNAVSTSGTVQSVSSTNVYTQLAGYPVESVAVKVGDRVNAGDVLCQLKPDSLMESIEKQRLSQQQKTASAQLQLQANQKAYNDTKSNLEKGYNNAINSAKIQLEAAQKSYDDAKADLGADTNATLVQRQNALDSARLTYQRASRDYTDAKRISDDEYKSLTKDYEEAVKEYNTAKNKLAALAQQLLNDPTNESLKKQHQEAKLALEEAEDTRDSAYRELNQFENNTNPTVTGGSLKSIRLAYENAAIAYENAQKDMDMAAANADTGLGDLSKKLTDAQNSYEAAKTSADQQLATAQNSIAQSKLNLDDSLYQYDMQNAEADLKDCALTAPVSGTVTAVNATVGASPTGVLFVIEDTDALEIKVKVKEFDIANVQADMDCVVTADSLAGQEFTGRLTRVSPAAIKQVATGATSNVEFEAVVQVVQKGTPLRIGMNAKADVIIEQKENTYAVPYEAVSTDSAGNSTVLVAKAQGEGFIAESVPVTLGMESDYEVEIFGDGLTDGMKIISDAKAATPGIAVALLGGDEAVSPSRAMIG